MRLWYGDDFTCLSCWYGRREKTLRGSSMLDRIKNPLSEVFIISLAQQKNAKWAIYLLVQWSLLDEVQFLGLPLQLVSLPLFDNSQLGEQP